jgi:hypothetical protein
MSKVIRLETGEWGVIRSEAGEYRISSEMWQREFGKTPSCRKSSDLRQEKTVGLRPNEVLLQTVGLRLNASAFFDMRLQGAREEPSGLFIVSNLIKDETEEECISILRLIEPYISEMSCRKNRREVSDTFSILTIPATKKR